MVSACRYIVIFSVYSIIIKENSHGFVGRQCLTVECSFVNVGFVSFCLSVVLLVSDNVDRTKDASK